MEFDSQSLVFLPTSILEELDIEYNNSDKSISSIANTTDIDSEFCPENSKTYPTKESHPNPLSMAIAQSINEHQSNLSPSAANPLYENLTTHEGSKYLQSYIKCLTPNEISELLNILCPFLKEIMCNCYGNYFLQELIKHLNSAQRIFVIKSIKKNVNYIAENSSGNHCLQCLFDSVETPEEEQLVKKSILIYLEELCIDYHGKNTIISLLNKINNSHRNYLIKFIISNFLRLSTNLNGATVVQKLIYELQNINVVKEMIFIMETNYYKMCKNQYANYIIQCALEKFEYGLTKNLSRLILNNFLEFALDKYASNVIDKVVALVYRNENYLFQSVVNFTLNNKSNFVQLVTNKFGKFVLINIYKLLN